MTFGKDLTQGSVLRIGQGIAYPVTKIREKGNGFLLVFCEHLDFPLRVGENQPVTIVSAATVTMGRCDAPVGHPGSYSTCNYPLDDRGECAQAANHIEL